MAAFDALLPLASRLSTRLRTLVRGCSFQQQMAYSTADLQTAQRHVYEGEQHLARQELMVTKLEAEGSDATAAKELLAVFRSTLDDHRKDRDMIAAELGQPT